ncbi:MAG TPA: hypothetical protein VJK50_00850 [Patescibacteria group bacterium]|nr:hypothetical protein [Patescibacteria group bacterium]
MPLSISVPEEILQMIAGWKEQTPARGRVLIPIKPRAKHAIIVTCGDPRFMVEQSAHFISLYGGPDGVSNAYMMTKVGGAVRLVPGKDRDVHFLSILSEVREVTELFGLGGEDEIDLWLCSHIECRWCLKAGLDLYQTFNRLQQSGVSYGLSLEPERNEPRFNVRHGFHHFWPRTGNHKTYELDLELAMRELAVQPRGIEPATLDPSDDEAQTRTKYALG